MLFDHERSALHELWRRILDERAPGGVLASGKTANLIENENDVLL